jgi:hypothetical protein
MLTQNWFVAAEGRVAVGYDAYSWIAKRLFILQPIAWILRIPLVAALGRRVYQSISRPRHCAMVTSESNQRAPVRQPEFKLVHRLGATMFVCQLGISSVMLLYSLSSLYSPKVAWLRTAWSRLDGIGKRGPFWPFDLYPTFTPATPPDIEIWEARWVSSSGRETRISPTAYDRTFGNAPLTMTITTGMLATEGSERGQARSLELVRLLWRSEIPDIRRSAAAVNVYSTEYTLKSSDNAPAVLLGESLLYTFPLELFSKEDTSLFVSTSPHRPQ